ncbi:MAG TPA: glucoamylase family protein [Saprospiraceae bacterium]|nr:glucoamylase family protein [Saprospiraceae bacterium]
MKKYANEKSPLRAELFSTEQLEQFAVTLAESHILSTGVASDQLLKRLEENKDLLLEVHNLLTESARQNSLISPAGEWLLDNFYLIEEQIYIGKKHFPKGYSETLPRLAKGPSAGLPRVYDIALAIISHSDGRVDYKSLFNFVTAYQTVTNLKLGELWAIPIMLRLALIENLRRLAAQIAIDRINKNLADSWADLMTETAEKDPKSLIVVTADMARSDPPMASSFVAELTRRLLGKGPALSLPLTWIEQRLSENGLTSNGLIHAETQNQAAGQVSMSNSIGSLRFLNSTDWREFVEQTSVVEKALRDNTNDVYAQMDFHTRDHYRHIIENIAKNSKISELAVTNIALQFARQGAENNPMDKRRSHVGYYLTGKGAPKTEAASGMELKKRERLRRTLHRHPFLFYAGSCLLLTILFTGVLVWKNYYDGLPAGWIIGIGLISFFATSYLAISLINWLVTIIIEPRFLPRMDFSEGIPASSKTIVVVPTLVNTKDELETLLETMEVRFLANKDENLHYALLTDFRDATEETFPDDNVLLEYAKVRIRDLNKKYKRELSDIFFLFHRPRRWNEADKIWMGYERKRGKLSQLNEFLRGHGKDNFLLIAGEEDVLHEVKYVITLDTDTQLPRDAAWKMIATISHPLNQPYYDNDKNRVTDGYGILQPRLAVSLPRTTSTLFVKMHGNEPGIDPYTRAVSDVYQDLLEEGSFIGKGIYEIEAFECALSERFPENRILSHDLLEGCHARSGLISDVQLYEEYPESYLADMKRRHRWIRGDWQIGRWLFPRVPGAGNQTKKNPLSALSRWKIFDNLRRSLVHPALIMLLLFAWIISDSPWFWTISVVGIIIPTSVLVFLWNLYKKPPDQVLMSHAILSFENLVNQFIQHVFMIITLPYEAFVNLDAIFRTNWRMFISHKKLLEWDPSVNGSAKKYKNLLDYIGKMWIGPVLGIVVLVYLFSHSPSSFIIASPILVLWIVSPVIAWFISQPFSGSKVNLSDHQKVFLYKLARKTWAYFENFVGASDNWLPPDNFQEIPLPKVAHRTSPTNIGISLLSNLSAYDFGYLTTTQLLTRCGNTLNTMQSLERYKGHFFNWYDTLSLAPLPPKYISAVDSGNLAAHLLTLKQGLLEIVNESIFKVNLFYGMRDTAEVLADLVKENSALAKFQDFIRTTCEAPPQTLDGIKISLGKLMGLSMEISGSISEKYASNEILWWVKSLEDQCNQALEELEIHTPWINHIEIPSKFSGLNDQLNKIPTLLDLSTLHIRLIDQIREVYTPENSSSENDWLDALRPYILQSAQIAKTRMILLDHLAQQCTEFSDYDYDFIYDKTQHLFSIGYNVEEHRKDPGSYDLLGSEARLGIFVAIAQGRIPQESWFALGRQLTNPGTDPVLLSWSGSMFEYLMPLLIVPSYENTLLDQTQKAAVKRQIEYGKKRGHPWGISESGYNMVAANLDYQYKAFGVPGLGFKRGLGDDIVIAPYATMMALMVDEEEGYENLRELKSKGYEGRWGFYEAIDYTPARMPRGQSEVIIKSYMAHHQGMSLLSLAFTLLNQPMQRRFVAEPQFQATLLLLQEKIPQITTFYSPSIEAPDIALTSDRPQLRVINTSNTSVPEVQLLSNGRYHVMVNNSGSGYSRWKDLAVTRWREDGTCDNHGTYCYIKDLETNDFWSSSHQPSLKVAETYEVIFSQGRAEFRRRDNNYETHTEIVVSPEDDVEIRRIHITNKSRKKRQIEITSYAEVVLNTPAAEALHPAFSNLFVQTEIIPLRQAILATRRPRSIEEHPPCMFHLMKVHGAEVQYVGYETSRDHFIGRGHIISEPAAMQQTEELSGSEGSVLDPIMAIRYRIMLKPYESVTVDMVYGIADDKDVCHPLIEKYQEKHMIDRAFELAWTHSQVILKQINSTEADSQLFGRLASSIIYANSSLRADAATIIKNQRGQSGLWSYSVSGDLPIVLLQIEDSANIELVQQLVRAHAFWRLKGLIVDLVIWNEDHGGYRQVLQNQILALIAPGISSDLQDKPGGIYIRSTEQITNEDRILFQTVARVIISDKLGSLEGQLNRRTKLRGAVPNFISSKTYPLVESSIQARTDLQFYNGTGGFTPDGKEYVIHTSPSNITPAPWSNILANKHFGTVISESGQSYTWYENAHELRLTPWSNDPVMDSGGENFYLRDEESGRFWSPAPLPSRGKTLYSTRHGFGYSVFEHSEDGMHSEMSVFVDIEKPVKFTVIKLRNDSGRRRRMTATGYIEWVLGDLRSKTTMHIVTELELNSGALLARNSYNTEFGRRIAFFDVDDASKTITTDREEFIGRNGTLKNPEGMSKSKLSGKTGAALDPCAAIQVDFSLEDGEEREIIFRLGTGANANDASNLIKLFRGKVAAKEALEKVKKYWQKTLSVIQINSPDKALNIISNGWLTYQTIACRLWARSGFYQSGGAFGYRDQLQDVMSVMHTEPRLARDQIILCASRQFNEGDVQHWWHPPIGRGVRTHCSDDYLWLPYVTSRYVLNTGDIEILNENVGFLEGRLLNPDEHSVYDLPLRSDHSATLYEHCVLAIEHGLRFGMHGLPLIGTGDWNDGMDRVGDQGKGESIWLAWFLYDTINRFIKIAKLKEDTSFTDRFEAIEIELQKNIELNGWDGEWYRRAYFDNGAVLGSVQNDECKIDSIAQSWAVLSRAGDPVHAKMGMEAADKQLIRREEGIIQLFDPPFDKSELNPGYIKGYVPGVRENGGQYTHAAIWMIMGFAALGDRKRTWELMQMINPVNHGNSVEKIATYKVEPYVIAADVYAVSQHAGRGGWTWYTGSAGWMYQLIIESFIGLKREGNSLHFKPCLPTEWNSVRVNYMFKETMYAIEITQEENGIAEVIIVVDDEEQQGDVLILTDDGKVHEVKVVCRVSVGEMIV